MINEYLDPGGKFVNNITRTKSSSSNLLLSDKEYSEFQYSCLDISSKSSITYSWHYELEFFGYTAYLYHRLTKLLSELNLFDSNKFPVIVEQSVPSFGRRSIEINVPFISFSDIALTVKVLQSPVSLIQS